MFQALRPLLFSMPTETSHAVALNGLDIASSLHLPLQKPMPAVKPIEVMGIRFPNRIGLAAGLDKNADHIKGLSALGFGFLEVGTVTPRPQDGNPKPRLFRLPEANAIINRMGFNNKGVLHLVEQVKKAQFEGVLGINIGKNKDTPADKAVDDYLLCMQQVYCHAAYITVNLSSPNTPGLRDLQFGEPLTALLTRLKQEQASLAEQYDVYKPLAVKIAPDMSADDTLRIAETLAETGIDAVIATNTTVQRDQVQDLLHGKEQGGLSGAPLTELSTELIANLARALNGALPIIGVGGIMNAEDAKAKLAAGAELLQVYSGFIYHGPPLIHELVSLNAQLDPA